MINPKIPVSVAGTPQISQTANLRGYLGNLPLIELHEIYGWLQSAFQKKAPGEWESVDELKAFERLTHEVKFSIKNKMENMLSMAHHAEKEGPFDGGHG